MARIVVIEDDAGVRRMIEAVLERAGHRVSLAAGAEDGVASVEREIAADDDDVVVITDIFMPDRDGLELTAELKARHPHLAVIAISGGGTSGDTSYLATAREFGADLALPKPFRPNELRSAVNEVLDRSS